MRWPNDRKVAEHVEVDMVLGGHDHDYVVEKVKIKLDFFFASIIEQCQTKRANTLLQIVPVILINLSALCSN